MKSLWRIIQRKYAEEAFSGEGSAKYGARWNQKGTPVVYCSESASLAQLEVLVRTQRTKEVFEDLERAREWLKSPQFALGGEIPLEYADTEPGAQIVEDLLGRIEHGTPV